METSSPSTNSARSRFFTWLRRGLIALVGLATLIAIFYTEENWRGKRAWETYKHEMPSQGQELDWSAYIPPAVPDDQNIFKAPKMTERFVVDGFAELSKKPRPQQNTLPPSTSFVGAELKIISPDAVADPDSTVLDLDDPTMPDKVMELARAAIGPSAEGARLDMLVVTPPQQIKPARISLKSKGVPNKKVMAQLFSKVLVRNTPKLEPDGANVYTNAYHLTFEHAYSAEDYLAAINWDDGDIALVREALKRPSGRIDGDYRHLFTSPIPNFIAIRNLVQNLSNRARCHLLLGQPDRALSEVTLIHEASRLLNTGPNGKPMTLVSSMMDVAVTGLYTATVADGIRLNAWRESDLTELQKQAGSINLLPSLAFAIQLERAGSCRLFETSSRSELNTLMGSWSVGKASHILLSSMPRGWFYLNMETTARQWREVLNGMDLTIGIVNPGKIDQAAAQASNEAKRVRPGAIFARARITSFDFSKPFKACARTQSVVNQSFIACALERYRMGHGQYPETLDALVPEYVKTLPIDIVNGKPLHYQRTEGGKFLLYSVGWNGMDDGGKPGTQDNEMDWVWGRSW